MIELQMQLKCNSWFEVLVMR